MGVYTAITRRVLVVCSDTGNGRVIEDATRAWMFETVVCSSLRESEALLGEKDFAVIFCEDRFADGAYPELLSIVGRFHKIPIVVMISSVEEDSVFREAMALGAFGVVPKPCSTKDAQWMVIRATQGGANSFKSTLSSGTASGPASNGPRRR